MRVDGTGHRVGGWTGSDSSWTGTFSQRPGHAMQPGRLYKKGSPYKLLENVDIARRILPTMVEAATRLAEAQATRLCQSALKEVNHLLGHEVQRLQMLQQVNDHIWPQEIKLAQAQQVELAACLKQTRLRLDSLRLIWKGPTEALK